eukprot:TRINITY_DN49941_c0_g1_i1.p1 TRINITY_DN49941_c0_g1~~TRINITY_DN49941_c0_g1_i1.p1  ORF type:complete len:384 (+),score=44.61 TRINITY_DN49941_c0_g1_i1:141-1292(+)
MAIAELPALFLHIDVNETILVGDPAAGESFEESLNKVIFKSAFVRRSRIGSLEWHDGSPLDVGGRVQGAAPPPLLCPWDPPFGALPVGRTKLQSFDKTFTADGSPGCIYRPLYDELLKALRWPGDAPADPRLLHEDGVHQLVLPAFFRLLWELGTSGRRHHIIIRTFGSDLPRVVAAVAAYAEGKHPLFPDPPQMHPPKLWSGRYAPGTGAFELLPDGERDDHPRRPRPWAPGGLPEAEALVILQSADMSGVRDDYLHWRNGAYRPETGKPLWLTLNDTASHHIFFDDNIHNDPDDSIVAVRVRGQEGQPFVPLTGEQTRRLHGAFLRKVPTWQPILDLRWFIDQIRVCEEGRQRLLDGGFGSLWSELHDLVRTSGAIEQETR